MLRRSPIFCRQMRNANRRDTDPKTMTRRVIQSQPPAENDFRFVHSVRSPHGTPGED